MGEVKESCMKGVWKEIWSHSANSYNFDPEPELNSSRHAVVDMTKAIGSENEDEENVDELPQSHSVELTTEDLLELKKETNGEEEETQICESIKQLTTRKMDEFLNHVHNAIKIIEENDPNKDRNAKVAREIENSVACYKELYRDKKNARHQLSLDHFIKSGTGNNPQLAVPGPSREPDTDNPDSLGPVISPSD